MFARAAARQHARAATPDGMTIGELQEIGRAAGLDPALVAAAAAETSAEAAAQETWHGVPVGTQHARLMPDPISDAEWEAVVDLLRAEFKVPGVVQQIGRRREWAPGSGSGIAVHVTVEARDDGDLVTIRSPDASRLTARLLGGSLAFIGVLLFALISLTTGEVLRAAATGGITVAFSVLIYFAIWLMARAVAARKPARHEALLDRIDLASRAEPAPRRLDLDALPDAPSVETGATRRRGRA